MSIPRPEYPRPQLIRDPEKSWLNLNGNWEFEIDFSASGKDRRFWEHPSFSQTITVPFCPESPLSGVNCKDFMAAVWYRRTVTLTPEQVSGRVFIRFGAVDYEATVWVNGKEAGTHKGGYVSFGFDITDFVKEGENVIVVCAEDDNRSRRQPRGKQSSLYYSHGCDYTRTTGIWQTVWLEFTPKTYIESYKVISQQDNSAVSLTVKLDGCLKDVTLTAEAFYEGKSVGSVTRKAKNVTAFELPLSEVHLWDVGQPNLYDLKLTLSSGDKVDGYFGLRDLRWDGDCMRINGRPVFQRLILDQGFYPDGIYTAPTDEALQKDIDMCMDLGFNGARLHEKVFEERFLYWADKKGYLVWGEMANWGLDTTNGNALTAFLPEWLEELERDFNHPSIVGWCPFNEVWLDAATAALPDKSVLSAVYYATKAVDPTRPVIDTSGGFHAITDIYDVHNYEQEPEKFRTLFEPMLNGGEPYDAFPKYEKYEGQPYFVSEYGGTWWNPSQDTENNWGYGNRPTCEDEVLRRFAGLTAVLLENPKICALCYTQLTDIEQEQNGLYSYDRSRKFSDRIYDGMRAAMSAKAAIEE
ncbi:MAG: beta-galactosidase [Oscillospiraceae bacterium]|nr:beta-galactosidase [Oscillospiraceae bacterium]